VSTPTNRGGAPSRVILDPVTLEPAGLIVDITYNCSVCGRGGLREVFDDLGQLVRRSPNGKLCWHYRANQLSTPTPSAREGG